jgi:peptidoglycan/LPS O-acetylase OafA/YrhL
MNGTKRGSMARLPLLDSIRGWAALSVLTYHTFGLNALRNVPCVNWITAAQAHRAAVLLFFTLSGYVIGATNKGPWSAPAVKRYGLRRFIRLEPIYLIGVLLGFAASTHAPMWDLLGNGLFLQNMDAGNPSGVQLLQGNQPLWSVHYEVLYYLLFVIWWRWPSTIPLFLASGIVVSFGGERIAQVSPFWMSHATGIVFWLAGLLISRSPQAGGTARAGSIWAHVSWLHAVHHATVLTAILRHFHFSGPQRSWLTCGDFALLPGCITLVALAAQRRPMGARAWPLLSFGMALLGCAVVIAGHEPLTEPRWAAVLFFTLAGAVAWIARFDRGLSLAERVGSFSYGLYAVHMPILVLGFTLAGSGRQPLVALACAAVCWALSFALAALLELVLQPPIRAWFLKLFEGASPRSAASGSAS